MTKVADTFNLCHELLSRGVVTEAQVKEAESRLGGRKRSLQDELIDLGMVSEEDILRVPGENTHLPVVDFRTVEIEPEAIKFLPCLAMQRHNVMPLRVGKDVLVVAMSNPLDLIALDDVARSTGRAIEPVLATRSQIAAVIRRNSGIKDASYDLLKTMAPADAVGVVALISNRAEVEQETPDTPTINLCDLIISDAVKEGASDIHIEPCEDKVVLRYRVDGLLKDVMSIPKILRARVVSRIKIMTGMMDVAEKRKSQDGRISARVGGFQVDLRVSTLPTYFGGKVVMRILDPRAVILDSMMQKMDGNEVCRRLRARLSTGHLPVIMLAAKNDLETELQGIGAGADDYIIKPFDPAHIVAHCGMLLSDGLAAARMVGKLGSQ